MVEHKIEIHTATVVKQKNGIDLVSLTTNFKSPLNGKNGKYLQLTFKADDGVTYCKEIFNIEPIVYDLT